MTPSLEVSNTLNCMHDTMKVLCYSQDAYDKYSTTDVSATLKQSGGNFGGGTETIIRQ